MNIDINSKVRLNNNVEIPYAGLGTYQLTGRKAQQAVEYALESGYRLIDTASAYGNEKEVGEAIKNSSVPREEIFVTTKLSNSEHGYDEALKAFDKSLKRLNLDYIDLYLIHWPSDKKRNDSWKAFEVLIDKGLCRSIGVSNYTIKHLNELFDNSSTFPSINQIEFNPLVYQEEILNFCKNKNIVVEGYTPLARTKKFNKPEVKEISEKYNKTPAQIFLRWSIQHEVIVIPKSSNEKRIKENIDLFDFNISDEDMEILNSLSENLRFSPDPHKMK